MDAQKNIYSTHNKKRKFRILYICIDSSLGGSTASLYNLIDSLKDYVEPIVLFPEIGIGYDFFIKKGIESYTYPFVKLNRYKANKLWRVWKHPWRWHYFDKIISDIGCYLFLRKKIADKKIDIVHSNTSPNDIGVYLSRKFKAKHVWHVREFLDLDFHADVYRGIPRLRNLINHADARIAVSNAIKNHWQMPDDNTWVIHNAVRRKEEKCYHALKEKYILFCSYDLTELKGTRFAIEAFAQSGLQYEGYRLVLMGNCDNHYYEILRNTACKYGVMDNLEFIPCQANVQNYFSHASAFIMASEYEAFGRVSVEAMLYGCPVIARATGGTLDIIHDGETGYLFSTQKECAKLLKKVCVQNQEQLILRAQEYAIDNFSQEVFSSKLLNVYYNILQRN